MSNKTNPYKNFPNYILRTPLFPFSYYKKLTSKQTLSDSDYKIICENPIFKEALYLSSPILLQEIEKWLDKGKESRINEEKIKVTILKYFSRMSSRCTPFGLFAGCSVGEYGNKTEIEMKKVFQNKRHTRLDMNFLIAFSRNLTQNKEVKKQLLFYPNSSIYKIGNKLRYIEYNYQRNRRHYQIVAIDHNEYLDKVLSKATKGILIKDLISDLVNNDNNISLEDASIFIEDLITNQILISELEPSVSGPEFMNRIQLVLKKMNYVSEITDVIDEIILKLDEIDQNIGNSTQKYNDLLLLIKKLETSFSIELLFQTNLIVKPNTNVLSNQVITDMMNAITMLNSISPSLKSNTKLNQFKNAFYERYESQEVPLVNALDVETGISYTRGSRYNDINPLIDDIILPNKQKTQASTYIRWDFIDILLMKKIQKAIKKNEHVVKLDENDFKDHKALWDDIPDTFSTLIEIVRENGEQKIKYNGSFDISASNLLNRFSYSDDQIYSLVENIINVEDIINKDKISAEIIHIPESPKALNILTRPDFRKYEIPYLAGSVKNQNELLSVNDLMISVKNNKIILRSKKYNKIVIPRLSNAHNFRNNALPIYEFLADMQFQGRRNSFRLSLSPLINNYEYIPRIEYRNIILHNAVWNLNKKHIRPLLNNRKLIEAIEGFRNELKIPQYVTIGADDNQLLINFKNIDSIKMFLTVVKKQSNFKLTEFLYSEESIIKSNNDYFTNQIILSFFNEKKYNEKSS